jgi:hypothetical protein
VVAQTQRVVGNESESAVLMFRIENAIPAVMVSDIRWYYTARTAAGDPDFNSSDFMDITNSSSRTTKSTLTYSGDLLTLTVSDIVQARRVGEDTDAGRYFLRASNPAGESSSFVDLVINGELGCHSFSSESSFMSYLQVPLKLLGVPRTSLL